jgi:hypothetical protein
LLWLPPRQVEEVVVHEDTIFLKCIILFQLLNRKSMFAALHTEINSPRSGAFTIKLLRP